MSKERQLLDSLETIDIGKQDVMVKLRQDFVKIIKGHLERNGWEATFGWVKEQRKNFEPKKNVLGRRMFHLYHVAYGKMWRLNKK